MANPNALTYNSYVTQIATMAIYQTTGTAPVVPVDATFAAIIPQMLNYAEMRIQRDLNLLAALIPVSSYTMTLGQNTLSVPVNDLQTIETVAIVNGTATVPLLPVSKEFIQSVYNDSATPNRGAPIYFAMYGGDVASGGNTLSNLLFGPYPDSAYSLVVTGRQWLPSLYVTSATDGTGTTYISTNYPDLLIQASMVYISQFQRNFLPTSNDPEMPGSFETQYQTLLKGAVVLEERRKQLGFQTTAHAPAPVATP